MKHPDGKVESVKVVDNVIVWNSDNSQSGKYKLLFQIIDKKSEQVTASLEKEFTINETFILNSGVSLINPNKVMVGTDVVVKNSINLNYITNYNKEVKILGEIKDSKGKIVKTYDKKVEVDKNKSSMTIDLAEFIPITEVKTQYIIKNTVYVNDEKMAEDENKFNVIEEIRNEKLLFKSNVSKEWLNPGEDNTDLLVELKGSEEGSDVEVKPLDLMLMLDYSGSMEGSKIEEAVNAAKTVIDMIGENDRVGILKFGGKANVTHEYSNDKESLKANLTTNTSGSTNIVNALNSGLDYMVENKRDDANVAVIFLSDGQDKNITAISDIAKDYKKNLGAIISAIGIGSDVREEALIAMVNATENGEYAFSPTAEEIFELMMEISGQLFNISAMDVELMLHLNNNELKLGDISCEREDIELCKVQEDIDVKEQDDGSKIVTWKKDRISFKDKYTLKFKLDGKNLEANSSIDILRDGYLKYKNPKGNTEILKLSNFPVKVSYYKIEDKITFDKENYVANDEVNINVKSTNLSKNEINLKTIYQIVDDKGSVVDTLLTLEENKYDGNQSKEVDLKWNTGKYINGDYQLKISYFEKDKFLFSNSKKFPVVMDGEVENSILTDRELYASTEEVNLTLVVKNLSENGVLEDIVLENRLVDLKGNILWRNRNSIDILMMEESKKFANLIDLKGLKTGEYVIKSMVYDSTEKEIARDEKAIHVQALEGYENIIGQIKFDKNTIEAYEDLRFNYMLKNNNDKNLSNINYKIEIIEAVQEKVLHTEFKTMGLNANQSKTEEYLWKHDLLEDGVYAVVISVKQESGEYKKIATELFNVSVPCKVSIETRNEWREFTKSNTIYPQFRVTNEFNENLNLKDFKIRYYYTSEHDEVEEFICDWASINTSNVMGNIVKKYEGNNSYLEISFKDGILKPGESMEIHTRIIANNWAKFDQVDDYSFNSKSDIYMKWDKVTGYFEDKHVYGKEPK